MGVGEGVGVGVGVSAGVAVGLAAGEDAGVEVGTAVSVGIGVIEGAGVSVGTAAAIRGARGGGSGELAVSAPAIAPKATSAAITPAIHQKHPPNLDDPPESDERDSERRRLDPDERRPLAPSLHE